MRSRSGIVFLTALFLFAGACSQKGVEEMQTMKADGLFARVGESVFLGGSDERLGRVEKIEQGKKSVKVTLKFDEPLEMVFSSVARDEALLGIRLIPSKMRAKHPVSSVEIHTSFKGVFSAETVLPYEIRNLIDDQTLFLMAETAPLGDNILFLLKRNGDLYKLETPLPPEGKLFTGKPEKIITAEPNRLSAFSLFLDGFMNTHENSWIQTPDNLDVQGGTLLFLYMRAEGREHSYRIEPEAPGRELVTAALDKLFQP